MKRILSLLVVLAVLGAACGNDADSAAEIVGPVDAESADAGVEATAPSADAASTEGRSVGDRGGDVESLEAADEAVAAEGESGAAEGSRADEGSDAAEPSAGAPEDAALADTAVEGTAVEDKALEEPPVTSTTIVQQPQAGTLTAADIDDNLNIGYFTRYLQRTADDYAYEGLPAVNTNDRVILNVVDANGEPSPNARLRVSSGQEQISLTANAYGTAYLFPGQVFDGPWDSLDILAAGPTQDQEQRVTIRPRDLDDDNAVTVTVASEAQRPDGLDVALVIDTTGSMGDELAYLTTEFTSIVGRLSDDYPGVDMRFALVVYRDEGDEYVTESYAFTGDVSEIQASLDQQYAEGGGDYPEAMDAALDDALDLDWRNGNVAKVVILNADAPPHAERFETVLAQAAEARERGIRIYPLAASGVGDTAEYLMRAMAATTGGRHLFLTDDSGVGLAHQEPKVQCYVVTRLDHLLIRVLSSELSTTRIEPLPSQLVRTVGAYDNGYCTDEQ